MPGLGSWTLTIEFVVVGWCLSSLCISFIIVKYTKHSYFSFELFYNLSSQGHFKTVLLTYTVFVSHIADGCKSTLTCTGSHICPFFVNGIMTIIPQLRTFILLCFFQYACNKNWEKYVLFIIHTWYMYTQNINDNNIWYRIEHIHCTKVRLTKF